MRAEISHSGVLLLIPENSTESFSIDQWLIVSGGNIKNGMGNYVSMKDADHYKDNNDDLPF